MTAAVVAAPSSALAIGLGRSRSLVAVADYAGASKAFRDARDIAEREGRGGSRFPDGVIYDIRGTTPRKIARVSYNGTVWALGDWKPGDRPLWPDADGGS